MPEAFEKRPGTGGVHEPLGAGELLDHDDRGLRPRAGAATVEVAAPAPDLFRVGMFPGSRTPDYRSEALAKEGWEPVGVSMRETANAAVPTGPDASHTGESPFDPLTLLVHPAADAPAGEATLYEDAGDGFGHEDGAYARRKISCGATQRRVVVRIGERGVRLELRGAGSVVGVSANGAAAEWRTGEDGVAVALEETAGSAVVEVAL